MSVIEILLQIPRVIANPARNLTAAALLLAIAVLILLILAVAALVTILPTEDEEEDDEGEGGGDAEQLPKPPPPTRSAVLKRSQPRIPRPVLLVAVGVLLAVAAVWGWRITGESQRCASCHATTGAAKAWRAGSHRAVACISCHEEGGAGLPAAAIARVSDAVVSAQGVEAVTGIARPVTSGRCLACHARDISGVRRVGAVRVSHKEALDAGHDCVWCHSRAGHAKRGASARVMMRRCVACHDGKRAAAACDTCHIGDTSDAVRVDDSIFPKVDIPPRPGCTGCHDTTRCTACHGLVMPHPADFGKGEVHARLAAFEKKEQLCYRCHVSTDCLKCHKGTFNAHTNWKQDHHAGMRLDGSQRSCACHQTKELCALCHDLPKR